MYYVMSDIHGCYDQMVLALDSWDSKKEHLVVMGDLIDRGPDSLKVVRHLMDLQMKHPNNSTVLMGNHEDMLLSWLTKTPYEYLGAYYNPAHRETLMSFMGDSYKKSTRKKRAEYLIRNNKEELNYMMSLPRYLETNNAIFVHAGIDLFAADWRTQEQELLWIRSDFIYSKTTPEKRVFFGHTPTRLINPSISGHRSDDIWISPDEMKVGIDGGVSMGGQLNVLRVNELGQITEILKFT